MKSPRPIPSAVPIPLRKRRPLAQPPGSLVHRGERRTENSHIHLTRYNETLCDITTLDAFPPEGVRGDNDKVTWLHFTGLHDVGELARIGQAFGISNLILEDILHTESRSKIENHESEIFVVTKLITVDEHKNTLDVQHFSLLLLHGNVVLTFADGRQQTYSLANIERLTPAPDPAGMGSQ